MLCFVLFWQILKFKQQSSLCIFDQLFVYTGHWSDIQKL